MGEFMLYWKSVQSGKFLAVTSQLLMYDMGTCPALSQVRSYPGVILGMKQVGEPQEYGSTFHLCYYSVLLTLLPLKCFKCGIRFSISTSVVNQLTTVSKVGVSQYLALKCFKTQYSTAASLLLSFLVETFCSNCSIIISIVTTNSQGRVWQISYIIKGC